MITLTRDQALEAGAKCSYTEKSEDILLYADEGQISQILINLIKNAIQAGAENVYICAEINCVCTTAPLILFRVMKPAQFSD